MTATEMEFNEEIVGENTPTVEQCLEMAIQTASDKGMATSELLGLFYYYTHSIAESYREEAIRQAETAAADGPRAQTG